MKKALHTLILAASTAALSTPVFAAEHIVNGDFSDWSGTLPAGWTGDRPADVLKKADIGGDAGSSTVFLRNQGNLRQDFATPIAQDFTLSFEFTINTQAASDQNLVLSVYQANQAVNPAAQWIYLRFYGANSTGTGNSFLNIYNGSSWVTPSGATAVAGSAYDYATSTFTSGPSVYSFVLDYSASTNTYSVSYGLLGGTTTTTHAGLAIFRNPTNEEFEGLNTVRFYSYNNGFSLDNVSLAAVPEPSAYATFTALGALALGVCRRRPRR